MSTPGLRSTPVTRGLIYFVAAGAAVTSIAGSKQSFHVQIQPHIWTYGQFHRILIWQLCYANAGEVLFATLSLYHMRVIERLYGSRKYLSVVALSFVTSSLCAPMVLILLRLPTFGRLNYLPSGMTSTIFAILAQYYAIVPPCYRFRISSDDDGRSLIFTDKIYVYLMAVQLALSQPIGSIICSVVGWVVGSAWRAEILPGKTWRLPKRWFEGYHDPIDSTDSAAPPQPLSQQIINTVRGTF